MRQYQLDTALVAVGGTMRFLKWIGAAGLVSALLLLVGWFVFALWRADQNVQVAVIGFGGAVTAAIIAHLSAKKREIQARLFHEKLDGYKALVDMIAELMTASSLGKKRPNDQQIAEQMVDFKKMLMVWADASTIKAWQAMEDASGAKEEPERMIAHWDTVLRALRRDLGMSDSQLKPGTLATMFIKASDRDKVIGE